MIKFKIPYEYANINATLYSVGKLDWNADKFARWLYLNNKYMINELNDIETEEYYDMRDEFYEGNFELGTEFEVEDLGRLLIDNNDLEFYEENK